MSEELLPRFVRVPAGEFGMGADDGDEDARPAHRVYVNAFHISVHAITNQQYAAFTSATGHRVPEVRDLPLLVAAAEEVPFRELAAPYVWCSGEMPHGRARHPVTLVTHRDAVAYCEWMSTQLKQRVRLLTEAEWECAARGGLDGLHYPWGDDIDPSHANFLTDPKLKHHTGTRPVGSYPPNALSLYDMSGNVWEWVADWYDAAAYRSGHARNPRGPAAGTLRVLRGGSWVTHDVSQLQCAHRHEVPADTYAYSIGFRIAYSDETGV